MVADLPKTAKYHKGIAYFATFEEARAVKDALNAKAQEPNSRVVVYQLGYAVQYYRSGPYFPEMDLR